MVKIGQKMVNLVFECPQMLRGVGTYTDAWTGPDKVLGKLYHKSSQGQPKLTKM